MFEYRVCITISDKEKLKELVFSFKNPISKGDVIFVAGYQCLVFQVEHSLEKSVIQCDKM